MRLSLRDPRIGLWLDHWGNAELGLGHFDAAVDKYHEAIDAGWRAHQPYRGLAAAYALEGKVDDAASALSQSPAYSQVAAEPLANIPALFEGLRKAGCRRNERDLHRRASRSIEDMANSGARRNPSSLFAF
jgi:hypothetical protein